MRNALQKIFFTLFSILTRKGGPPVPKFTNLGGEVQQGPLYQAAIFRPLLKTRLRDTCCQRSAISLTVWPTDTHNKPVGFYGPIVLPVPNAPSSWICGQTIHRRHRRKKWWTRILKFEFRDIWEFFEIFKKASRGPSAADLDHYGHGQTRSE